MPRVIAFVVEGTIDLGLNLAAAFKGFQHGLDLATAAETYTRPLVRT